MILVGLYLLIIIFLFSYIYRDIRRIGWSAYSYLSIVFIFFYLLPGFILVSTSYFNLEIDIIYTIFKTNQYEDFYLFLVILIAFFLLSIGAKSSRKRSFSINTQIRKVKPFNKLMYFFSIISFVALILYSSGFGSAQQAILDSKFIRSGHFLDMNYRRDTSFVFFYRFIFLAIIPLLYFYYTNYVSKRSKIFWISINLFTLIILYSFLANGRQNVIDFFIIIFITNSLIKEKKHGLINLLFLAIFLFLSLSFLQHIFGYPTLKTTFVEKFLNEFAFTYLSLQSAIINNPNYLFFSDFYYDLFSYILPSSWSEEQLKTSNYMNSNYLIGKNTKSIPPGFLAQGYYSLGFIGLMIISFLSGKLIGLLDSFFKSFLITNKILTFIYVLFFVKMMSWLRTGLPHNFFYDFLILVLFLLLIFILKYNTIKLVKVNE